MKLKYFSVYCLFVCLAAAAALSACGKDDTPPPASAAQTAPNPTDTQASPQQMPEQGQVSPQDQRFMNRPGMGGPMGQMGAMGMAGYGVIVEAPPYTQNDLEYVKAIKEGNVRRVKSDLDSGKVNIHSGDENGISGLIIASSLKNSDVVDAILANVTQGDIKVLDRADKSARTPLFCAADSGTPDIINILRKKGANPNLYNVQQDFPLLVAVRKNDMDSVKALIHDYGSNTPQANLDLQSSSGESAILAAAKNNNRDMIKLLKDAGANMNNFDNDGITPLIYAVSKNDRTLFDYILSMGADINFLGIGKKTPLLYAIETENYEFAKYILDRGGDPNVHVKDLPSALQMAVSSENADPGIVDYLLSKKASLTDPNIPLGNVIGRSIHKGNAPAIAKLIAGGAKVSDLEDKNNNGLLEAINVGDENIAILMIDNGADMNKMDNDGYTPLALSAEKGLLNVFDTLVKRGVDVNQTSINSKLTPLEIVMDKDNAEMFEMMFDHGLKANLDVMMLHATNNKENNIIQVLLKHGASPNITNNIGRTALLTALNKGDIPAARSLADQGADLNVQDVGTGLTPLSMAISKGNVDIAQYFIDKGANPNLPDNNGYSSLAYAAATGQADLVKSLIAHGADIKATDKNGVTIPALVDMSKMEQDKKDKIKELLLPSVLTPHAAAAGATQGAAAPATAAPAQPQALVPTQPAQQPVPPAQSPAPPAQPQH